MALELFKRIPNSKGLFAVEKISLIYNLLTSLLILFVFKQMEEPWHLIIDRGLIVALTFLLMYLYRLAPCKLTVFVRVAVQMSLLAYWYPDTYEFNRFLPNLDHVFATAEQALCGGQPALSFCHLLPYKWVSEAFHFGYFFYYPMMAIAVIYHFVYHFKLFEKCSFVLVTSFFIYYFFYIAVPVAGPQFYFPAIGLENAEQGVFYPVDDYFKENHELMPGPGYDDGLFYKLVENSQQVGERPTAAFPSSHVGISTIIMIMVWRVNRKLFAGMFPIYLLLCGATVYIQAHYLIDVIAGLLSAFLIYPLVTWMFKKWFAYPMFGVNELEPDKQ